MKKQTWRERDFEEWFTEQPVLPGNERLVVVSKQTSIRTMVDVLCLDSDGRLVLLEAKNETTTRAAIGQALEYLSVLDGATLDDLSTEAGEDVGAKFIATFGVPAPSPLPHKARILIAAPDFLPSSAIMQRWLATHLLDVTVTMLRVLYDEEGFHLEEFTGPEFTRARNVRDTGPAMSQRGRAYCVLQTGPQTLMWHIGRPRRDGTIELPSGKALAKNALRVDARRFLSSQPQIDGLDLELHGTVWRHRRRGDRGTLLGGVKTGARWQVVLCREDAKGRVGIRARDEAQFRDDWQQVPQATPSWTDLARRIRMP